MALGSLIQDWKVSFCLVLEDQLENFLLYREHEAACLNILWATPKKYCFPNLLLLNWFSSTPISAK